MRIAVSCHPTQGGSGIVATELACALAERGHEVHIVSSGRPFRLKEDCPVTFHDVGIFEYPLFRYPPHDLSLANRLAGVVKRFDIDIIHAHYAVPHAVAALLARQIADTTDVRVITTLHGTDITFVGSHRDFFDLIRHAMIHSDAVTAVSDWLRDETMSRFSLPEAPEVIPNFFCPKKFNPDGRTGYPDAGQPFHLVHASNLRPVKRVSDIVRVFDLVQREIPARLTILGDGPEKGTAEELAAELNLSDRIEFAGMSNEMPDVLKDAHLYLLLSDYESFGLSALEAMACGTPVAAYSAGGITEVVTDGISGLFATVGDVAGMARRIVELLNDGGKWQALSDGAAASAIERFPASAIVSRYEELYERTRWHRNFKG